jgi:hypothetical protein
MQSSAQDDRVRDVQGEGEHRLARRVLRNRHVPARRQAGRFEVALELQGQRLLGHGPGPPVDDGDGRALARRCDDADVDPPLGGREHRPHA